MVNKKKFLTSSVLAFKLKYILGTSAGLILLYEIPIKGTNIEIIQELHDSTISGGITCLASDNDANFLCCGDTTGNVGVWRVKSNKNVKFSYSLNEKNK